MTNTNLSKERLWNTLLQRCRGKEPPLTSVVALLADIRHWCDRHDESYMALSYAAHELYLADVVAVSRRQS